MIKCHHHNPYQPIVPHADDDDCPSYVGEEEAAIRALEEHNQQHEHPHGMAHCEVAMQLYEAIPDAERVVWA